MKALSRTREANGSTCGITTELTQLLFQYYSLPSTNENTILFVDKVFKRVEGAIDEWMKHAKPTRGGGRLDGSTDESLQLMRVVVELIMKDVAKVFHDIQREKGAATLEYVVDACTLKLLSAVDEVPDSASKESSQHWLLLKRWMIITQIPHPSNFSRVYEPQHTHVLDLLHYGSAMRVAERVVAFVKGSKLPSVLAAEVVSKPEKPPSLKLSDSVYRFGAIFSAMIVVIPRMVATPALRTSIQSLVEPFTTQARKYRSAGHSRRGATLFSFLLSMGLHHNRFALLRCRNARLPWDWNDCWSNYARLLHHKMNDDNSEQVIQMVDVATVLMEQPERVVHFHGNWLLSTANYGAATTRTSSSRRVRE